jgi:hypothetical protein
VTHRPHSYASVKRKPCRDCLNYTFSLRFKTMGPSSN